MLRLFLLSLSASCGNSFLLWPEVPKILAGWNRQCSAPISTGTAQKETHLIPKLNRMPDGSQRVKVSPPKSQAKFTFAHRQQNARQWIRAPLVSTSGRSSSSPDNSANCEPCSKPAPAIRWRHIDGADTPANSAGTRGNRTPDQARSHPVHTAPV